MDTVVTWMLMAVFRVLLVAELSLGYNNVCPKEKTENYTVINMCNSDTIIKTDHLFLDIFIPASSNNSNNNTDCSCTLQATEHVQIGVSSIIMPVAPCESTVTVFSDPRLNMTCGYPQETPFRNIGTGDLKIQLVTSETHKNVTYCLGIFVKSASGNLSIQCFTPPSATTSSTQTSTTSPTTSSMAKTTPVVSSSATTAKTLTTTLSSPDPESFPVAAVAGGVAGAVAVLIAVIVVYIVYKRRKTKGLEI
ncbi:uncharacterized protein LOC121389979 isoform X2 [Gigantopelta aegis]|uniref:uncharacterized protein LOC121389979 isoform X2 n=1 Tax=Gigantopelta aegis TaxID=1735272 RepID=UPI001B88889F|nr:uncharacterized protein LOC121389979 isoform X2 [Gigantopelta aegis]